MKRLIILVLVMAVLAGTIYACHTPEQPPVTPPVQNNTTEPVINDTPIASGEPISTDEEPVESEPVTVSMQETR